ncbi:hypothetical protein BRADI_1g16643v3 [Brachypodium distachyon]|uniref:Uncharacterized protein n=1 Tax=Brachypodium distachyon TaxID=15368 RepID=A0A2K2DJS8_BRADI|nr:hypothetical protein BRADI_1g16643v3 [Brachypodium distachyon]
MLPPFWYMRPQRISRWAVIDRRLIATAWSWCIRCSMVAIPLVLLRRPLKNMFFLVRGFGFVSF